MLDVNGVVRWSITLNETRVPVVTVGTQILSWGRNGILSWDHVSVGPFDANNPAHSKFSVSGQPFFKVFQADVNSPILDDGGVCDKECHRGSAADASFEIFKIANTGPWGARYLGPSTNDLSTNGAPVNWDHDLRIEGPMRKCVKWNMHDSTAFRHGLE